MVSVSSPGPIPTPLWEPDEARRARSRLARYLRQQGLPDYQAAWQWSVAPDTAGPFWQSVAEEFGVSWHAPPEFALIRAAGDVAGARWFGGSRLNYAEHALRPPPG